MSRILICPQNCAIVAAMATVELTPQAAEQLERLPKGIHARVSGLLVRLTKWPNVSGAKALSGNLAGWYRLRTGDYRVRFRVEGNRVIVKKIGHRREFMKTRALAGARNLNGTVPQYRTVRGKRMVMLEEGE